MKLLIVSSIKHSNKTFCLQCIYVNSAAWCVWEVLKVIGNRGHVLVKTKLCVGEGLCLHSGAPAWLQRVWLWHYRTHLIGPIEMTWWPMLGKKGEKRWNSIYINRSRAGRDRYWSCILKMFKVWEPGMDSFHSKRISLEHYWSAEH